MDWKLSECLEYEILISDEVFLRSLKTTEKNRLSFLWVIYFLIIDTSRNLFYANSFDTFGIVTECRRE